MLRSFGFSFVSQVLNAEISGLNRISRKRERKKELFAFCPAMYMSRVDDVSARFL